MKTIILIILSVLLTNTVRSQEPCMGDDCSIVFEFSCVVDPFNLTDEQIDNADRNTLLQSLVDITTDNGNTITSVEHIPTANKFQVKVSIGNGSFTYSASGNETVLEDIHPQHFREFYKYIVNYILNNF